jgi:hypothetical protein
MAWSDFSRGERYQRLGSILILFGLMATSFASGSILFDDISSQKREVVSRFKRDLLEVCLVADSSVQVKLECKRFENVFDIANDSQLYGLQPLPRLSWTNESILRPVQLAYDKEKDRILESIETRKLYCLYAFILFLVGGLFLTQYGSSIRRSFNAKSNS